MSIWLLLSADINNESNPLLIHLFKGNIYFGLDVIASSKMTPCKHKIEFNAVMHCMHSIYFFNCQ